MWKKTLTLWKITLLENPSFILIIASISLLLKLLKLFFSIVAAWKFLWKEKR